MAEPYCLAMILCDGVHRDPTTGKFSVLGIYDTFASREYPALVDLKVYFAITDGIGNCDIRLQMVSADSEPIVATEVNDSDDEIEGLVFQIGSEQEFGSPLVVHEQVVQVQFYLPAPGMYLCELWANDNPLMTRRFRAHGIKGDTK